MLGLGLVRGGSVVRDRSIVRKTWNVPGNSVDKDMHCEHTRQMGVEKYLGENCYHHIKCSIANSLAALMRK